VTSKSKRTTPSGDAVGPAAGTPVTDIENLINRSADLKRDLVAFAKGPRFSKHLTARLRSAADHDGSIDEATAVFVIDHFALQHRFPDGRTIVERFIQQRRPLLSADERAMLLGWRDVVEGCFEVHRFENGAVMLHNLVDDLIYRVHSNSNMGHSVFAQLHRGMFVVGRIVPVHPATDAWLVSGHLATFPAEAGPHIAQDVLQLVIANPGLLRRNPDKLRRAWELQTEDRADFVAVCGSDLVVLPPGEAQEKLCEYYRRCLARAEAASNGEAAKRVKAAGLATEKLAVLPEELLDADSVALVYDSVEGLNHYRDFGRLDDLFADPSLARDRTYLEQLREYLHDDSVSPTAIRRLVDRHPDGANTVFRTFLGMPGFSWERDGERMLRHHKKSYFHAEPTPSISVIGDRLVELLSVVSGPDEVCPD
jgi:hypothetical protein